MISRFVIGAISLWCSLLLRLFQTYLSSYASKSIFPIFSRIWQLHYSFSLSLSLLPLPLSIYLSLFLTLLLFIGTKYSHCFQPMDEMTAKRRWSVCHAPKVPCIHTSNSQPGFFFPFSFFHCFCVCVASSRWKMQKMRRLWDSRSTPWFRARFFIRYVWIDLVWRHNAVNHFDLQLRSCNGWGELS